MHHDDCNEHINKTSGATNSFIRNAKKNEQSGKLKQLADELIPKKEDLMRYSAITIH